MTPSPPSRPACNSLGKITAKLLLSFLVLSFTGASARLVVDTDIPVPGDVLAPGPVIVGGEDHMENGASEGVHEFVCAADSHVEKKLADSSAIESPTHPAPRDIPVSFVTSLRCSKLADRVCMLDTRGCYGG